MASIFSDVNLLKPWSVGSSLESFLAELGSGSIVSSKASLVAKLLFMDFPAIMGDLEQ